jgi:orotidine-5'-phosphate decarboxylase
MTETFYGKLKDAWGEGRLVCVGLDTVYDRLPGSLKTGDKSDSILKFNKAIIEATAEFACAFKPNSAFYERLGSEGLVALGQTIGFIHETYPGIPVILDSKRGDIDSSSESYAYSAFDLLKADAATVNPYLGESALQPFLERKDKGIIVLGANSNPGAGEFQDLTVGDRSEPLYLHVSRSVAEEWNKNKNCAVTAGATEPGKVEAIRSVIGEMPILLLGVGAQGGDLNVSVKAGRAKNTPGLIINSSRSILYASNGPDFAEAAGNAAKHLNMAISQALTH